jgi:DNA replication and repair protein RecF
MGLIPTVLHAPEDIFLISGAPSNRRRFINLHIAQTDPLYVHHLLRYHKAMKQRNALLKQKNEEGIQSWEQTMAVSARYLITKRQEAALSLNLFLQDEVKKLSSNLDELKLQYLPSFAFQEKEEIASLLCSLWKKQRPKELYLGTTLSGPHRDDVLILLNKQPAKSFSSEGQKKCCVTALRFAEWKRLKSLTPSFPLLSLDDFEVHLDIDRQHYLKNELKNFGQVFLTSPYQKNEGDLLQIAHELTIENGQASLRSLS